MFSSRNTVTEMSRLTASLSLGGDKNHSRSASQSHLHQHCTGRAQRASFWMAGKLSASFQFPGAFTKHLKLYSCRVCFTHFPKDNILLHQQSRRQQEEHGRGCDPSEAGVSWRPPGVLAFSVSGRLREAAPGTVSEANWSFAAAHPQ